jgi:hypothetical protein
MHAGRGNFQGLRSKDRGEGKRGILNRREQRKQRGKGNNQRANQSPTLTVEKSRIEKVLPVGGMFENQL